MFDILLCFCFFFLIENIDCYDYDDETENWLTGSSALHARKRIDRHFASQSSMSMSLLSTHWHAFHLLWLFKTIIRTAYTMRCMQFMRAIRLNRFSFLLSSTSFSLIGMVEHIPTRTGIDGAYTQRDSRVACIATSSANRISGECVRCAWANSCMNRMRASPLLHI